ncbi:MAG: transcriptional regulator [Anaerolineales bacterium]|nr:transcriptional regulator [Anaerolineales bacterium]
MNEYNRTRAKILGVLIRDARLYAGRTIEDCAKLLHLSPEAFIEAEIGERILSLPDLEALSMYLDVSLDHFWGDQVIGRKRRTDYTQFVARQNERIGRLLREARQQEGRAQADLANEIKVTPEKIAAYESGEEPVPLLDLDRLARYLGHSLNYFIDDGDGLLADHEAMQKMKQRLDDLPPDVRAFVAEPINISYLEIAMRLSRMNVKELRTVAENILNITF